MREAATEPARLNALLADIRARYPSAEPEWVADVVRAVMMAVRGGEISPEEQGLLAEVEALGRVIANAKAEIAALRVDDLTTREIPFATDELDAIVAHTASATEAILESCEGLDSLGGDLQGELAARLQECTTRIYEACSFQDITGQRITKVVTALKAIEARVAAIVATFSTRGRLPEPAPVAEPEGEAALLNGPQLPEAAMNQSGIDALLASFD